MFKVISEKGSVNIVKDNFVYRTMGVLKSGEQRWRCNKNNCPAWLYTLDEGKTFSRQVNEHNHEPRGDNRILRNAISNSIKRKLDEEEIDGRPCTLVHAELSHNRAALGSLTRRDVKCIRDNITNARLKKFPKCPKPPSEAQEPSTTTETKTAKDGHVLLVNDTAKGIQIYSCEPHITDICEGETVLMDETLEDASNCVSHFTIRGYRDGAYAPLVYCQLPDKKQQTYTRALKMAKEAYQQRSLHFQPSTIVVDIGQAIHQSLVKVFPDSNIVGSHFLLGQTGVEKS